MNKLVKCCRWMLIPALVLGCGEAGEQEQPEDFGSNPFLDVYAKDKEDTSYVNVRGVEAHVTLEGDIQASGYRIFDAPTEQAQFAVTHLRKREDFYLEILAEDTTAPARVEWLVDGEWLTREQASSVDRSKLTHWRMLEVNAVVLNSQVSRINPGEVHESPVPLAPYSIMQDADDKCADYNSHISLGQGVYWYLWNPRKSDCPQELLTTLNVTVEEVLPHNVASYPEYDQLWADQTLTAAIFFAKLDDGDVADDYNWNTFNRFTSWLTEAEFEESPDAPMGKRYLRRKGELSVVVDVYGPDVFHSVADYSRFNNWQRAVSEHEIVVYNGHSVLGTGYAFEEVDYPDFYQIFQVASCLSYEYYVRPVLTGKGDWANVDVLSNVEPTYYSENLPLTSAVLAKLIYGFENEGRASWQDVMEAVSRKLGHYRFGVSGARENCFTPDGDRCDPGPGPDPDEVVVENTEVQDIPDNDATGILSTIQIEDSLKVKGLKVELDVTHTYIGDLRIVLEHNGKEKMLWGQEGGSADDIRETFEASSFKGDEAQGTWTLKISDHYNRDVGKLNHWTLRILPDDGSNPDPDPLRYENTSEVSIPDSNADGVTSVIEVPDDVTIADLSVELDIRHSYIGDLMVVLSHDGTEYALHDRSGGSADDLVETYTPAAFEGQRASGTWTLRISDHASMDLGNLKSWALAITPEE